MLIGMVVVATGIRGDRSGVASTRAMHAKFPVNALSQRRNVSVLSSALIAVLLHSTVLAQPGAPVQGELRLKYDGSLKGDSLFQKQVTLEPRISQAMKSQADLFLARIKERQFEPAYFGLSDASRASLTYTAFLEALSKMEKNCGRLLSFSYISDGLFNPQNQPINSTLPVAIYKVHGQTAENVSVSCDSVLVFVKTKSDAIELEGFLFEDEPQYAANASGAQLKEQVLGRVTARLRSDDYRTRIEGIRLISGPGLRNSKGVEEALIGKLADPEPLVRGYAVKALGTRKTASAKDALRLQRVKERDPLVLKLLAGVLREATP